MGDELTERIIGAAIEVHRVLGPGLLESIYEEALAYELDLRGIRYQRQAEVTVNYKGTLVDGTEFDSSYKRGQPASFPVTGVIPGWTEALQLLKVGSKVELAIPPELAYGANGPLANQVLLFEVELLSAAPTPAEASK
jgi:FKBP-type peptidyl-prolyl cis-trans isomerase